MNDKNRNLVIRIVSALILLPIVVWLVWRGGWWFAGLVAFAAGACASEYSLIVFRRIPPMGWVAVVGAGILPLLPHLHAELAWTYGFFVIGLMFLVTWTWHLIKGPLAEAPVRSAHTLNALVYGGIGFVSLSALRLLPETGLGWVIAALTVTWANDTSAYFAGRFLGRHKLYPEVSPNKTWEGFFGGVVGSVIGMFVLKFFFFSFLTTADCLAVGIAGGILGPIGDLVESMLKRAYQVKDSGKIIPGHGGLLDRVDALIFNAPMVFAWVAFVRTHLGPS